METSNPRDILKISLLVQLIYAALVAIWQITGVIMVAQGVVPPSNTQPAHNRRASGVTAEAVKIFDPSGVWL